MNAIVWLSRDNRLLTVNVKWLESLPSTNNCARLEHFSTRPHLGTWGVSETSILPFCSASCHKTLEVQLMPARFTAAICFYFNERRNCPDKWLYLTERSLFVCFWSKYCHKIWLSTAKMRNSVQAAKQPISVFHWILPYKRRPAYRLSHSFPMY